MIILEKPYVSAPLVAYLEDKQIPVLHNDMAETLKQQGHNLNLLDDKQFVEKYLRNTSNMANSMPFRKTPWFGFMPNCQSRNW